MKAPLLTFLTIALQERHWHVGGWRFPVFRAIAQSKKKPRQTGSLDPGGVGGFVGHVIGCVGSKLPR